MLHIAAPPAAHDFAKENTHSIEVKTGALMSLRRIARELMTLDYTEGK